MLDTHAHTEQALRSWLERAQADAGAGDAAEVKRDEARTPWVVSVDLALDVPGGERRIRSRTRDISDKGLGIHCREEIPIGKAVRVYLRDGSSDGAFVEGKVNHCTMTVGGYKIGARVAS